MDASVSSRSKEKTVVSTDLPPETVEKEPLDKDDENGDDQSSTMDNGQSFDETDDQSAPLSRDNNREELPGSSESSESGESNFASDFIDDSKHSDRRRRRRRFPDREKGQSRTSTRKHVDDPRNT